MTISGFQKLTLLDYPGKTAAILFTGGCNFRCPFCHNAPLVLGGEERHLSADLLAYLKKRAGLLDGLVVSGGEPCLQPDLAPFLAEVKALGYAVKLDTNGSFPASLAALVEAGLVDAVAMDIKNSPDRYARTAGVPRVDLAAIRESIAFLRQSERLSVEFRTTVVRPLHDRESLIGAASLIPGAPLWFLQSFVDSGHLIAPDGLSAFSADELAAFCDVLRPLVPGVRVRG